MAPADCGTADMDTRSMAVGGGDDDNDDEDSGVSPNRVISIPKIVTFLVVIHLYFFRPTRESPAGVGGGGGGTAVAANGGAGGPMISNARPGVTAWRGFVEADPAALSAAPPKFLPLMARLDEPGKPVADVPFFLHCPKAGGTTVIHLLIEAYHFPSPVHVGISADIDALVAKRKVASAVNLWQKALRGPESRRHQHHQQPIVTPLFFDAQRLLERKHRGRMFTVLRHPVDRMHSLFYYLRMNPPWEKHGRDRSDLKNMTFAGNWVVGRRGERGRSALRTYVTPTPSGTTPMTKLYTLETPEIIRVLKYQRW